MVEIKRSKLRARKTRTLTLPPLFCENNALTGGDEIRMFQMEESNKLMIVIKKKAV